MGPHAGCRVSLEPVRSTGGDACTTAGVPGGRTRNGSPWQAAQLVARSGTVRSATPFTWSGHVDRGVGVARVTDRALHGRGDRGVPRGGAPAREPHDNRRK